MPPTDHNLPESDTAALGRIDIHSHMLPGLDDGCRDWAESLLSIQRLKECGFVGSICTPHIWPELFPQNLPEHIRAWTIQLQQRIDDHGIEYRLWPGGELRLFKGVLDWMKRHGAPTLADSRCVLVDLWEEHWHNWIDEALDWLLAEDYLPILAHPERIGIHDLPERLTRLTDRGVLLQGNFRCLNGDEGFLADQWVRRFLLEKRYTFMAVDMHRPDSLESRLAGIEIVREEFGGDVLDQTLVLAPRQYILGEAADG